MNNLIALHEAMVLALIKSPNRTASITDIASFIENRKLFVDRKGSIPLEKQIELRLLPSGNHSDLFDASKKGNLNSSSKCNF